MHYYQFNIGDYASHTAHLDPLEDIAYRRMLDWIYLHESPLPLSVKQISKYIRMRDECDRISDVINEFFIETEYGYSQKKADNEIKKYRNKSEKAKQSAQARWGAKPIKQHANALPTQSERNANHKPLTTKHNKHIDQSKIEQNEICFQRFWTSGIRKIKKKETKPKFIKLLNKQENPEQFTNMLINDIQQRINSNQLGFDKIHPTTYLNGERWNDEITSGYESQNSSEKLSVVESTRRATDNWAERQRNINSGKVLDCNV